MDLIPSSSDLQYFVAILFAKFMYNEAFQVFRPWIIFHRIYQLPCCKSWVIVDASHRPNQRNIRISTTMSDNINEAPTWRMPQHTISCKRSQFLRPSEVSQDLLPWSALRDMRCQP